jgi:hypothetical protein
MRIKFLAVCVLCLVLLISCSSEKANEELAFETFRRSVLLKLPQKELVTLSTKKIAEALPPKIENCAEFSFFVSDSLTILRKKTCSINTNINLVCLDISEIYYTPKFSKTLFDSIGDFIPSNTIFDNRWVRNSIFCRIK